MNVWKIASRWSDDGNPGSSIIRVFRKNNVVFLGTKSVRDKFVEKVKMGDFFAISDGISVVAVAKALGNPKNITEFIIDENDKDKFDYEDWVFGVKVKIVDLNDDDKFDYCRGTFHHAHEHKDKIIELYTNQDKKFSITSRTCILRKDINSKDEAKSILGNHTRYVIPIFQRIYSWNESQIEPFLSDIFNAYWGTEKIAYVKDPIFIGTMQLSEKKFIDKNEYEQYVIDGQQRLSTILVLLKVLKLKYPESVLLHQIEFDWLETRVNNGQQEKYLLEFINYIKIEHSVEIQNPYFKNSIIIESALEQYIKNEENELSFNVDDFIQFLFNKVYFVVIETYAGLSKTLQIFNAINTTGLDLNGGDIFKIRMYEYLTVNDNDESVFDKISGIYELIDIKNHSKFVTDIRGILSIYHYSLIAKYNLPNTLYSLGVDNFFDKLFDSLLGINEWPDFKNLNGLVLEIDEIVEIINIRYDWEIQKYKMSAEFNCALRLINGWSRYSKYWTLLFVFLYKYKDDPDKFKKLNDFIISLNKLYSVYSVRFWRLVNRIYYTFSPQLAKDIFILPFDQILERIKNQIENENNKEEIKQILSAGITGNHVVKNIICRSSAMLDEVYSTFDSSNIIRILEKLFEIRIDIEHIQSYNDEILEIRDLKQEEWGNDLNSIGNLVVLEESINRRIGNKTIKKTDGYNESQYNSVISLANDVNNWTLDKCKKRKDSETNKLIKYWFS